MLTVDTAVLGRRERDVRRGFSLPPTIGPGTIVDGALHPAWTWAFVRSEPIRFANVVGRDVGDGASPVTLSDYINTQFDPALSWDDVDWLRSVWDGPIVLKGIQTVDDAVLAADAGVEAIALSNHGGRQLDGAPAPFALVAPVADAVGGRIEIICDGGVRRGSDIVKAVAAGATRVHGRARVPLRARRRRRARRRPRARVVPRRHRAHDGAERPYVDRRDRPRPSSAGADAAVAEPRVVRRTYWSKCGMREFDPAVARGVDHALTDQPVAKRADLRRAHSHRLGDRARTMRSRPEPGQRLHIGDLGGGDAGDARGEESRIEGLLDRGRGAGHVGVRDGVVGGDIPGVVRPRLHEEREAVRAVHDRLGRGPDPNRPRACVPVRRSRP